MKKSTGRGGVPQAREEGLVIHELPDEVLVYDLDRHKAHCLNDFASHVWKRCDGRTTVKEMASLLERKLQKEIREEEVWLALDRLGKARLLMERPPLPGDLSRLSRREAVRKFGLAAGLAMVTSIVAPTAAMAASCVNGTSCQHVCSQPLQVGRCCGSTGRICRRTSSRQCSGWTPGQPEAGNCVSVSDED